jgi:hypothetical protein
VGYKILSIEKPFVPQVVRLLSDTAAASPALGGVDKVPVPETKNYSKKSWNVSFYSYICSLRNLFKT